MAVIELTQVRLERDKRLVLDDISLQLNEQRIGLIGYNGSGKSSLLRLLNGLLLPSSGQVRVQGLDPVVGPAKMAAQVGFIFQNPDHQLLFPTVGEELRFGLLNLGMSKAEGQQRVEQLLAEHQRLSWLERPVHSLSDGQKQWLCIMAVLLMEPKLLVLDEPFSALDLPSRYYLLDWLLGLPQQLLMVSHELETLAQFERIIWLDQGRIRADGPPAEVLPEYSRVAKQLASQGLGYA